MSNNQYGVSGMRPRVFSTEMSEYYKCTNLCVRILEGLDGGRGGGYIRFALTAFCKHLSLETMPNDNN